MVFCNKYPLSIFTHMFVSYLVFIQVKGVPFHDDVHVMDCGTFRPFQFCLPFH